MLGLVLVASGIYGGYRFINWIRPGLNPFEQWLYGLVVGIILQAYTGLGLSYLMGFNQSSQLVTATVSIIAAILFQCLTPKQTSENQPIPGRPIYWLLILLVAMLVFIGSTTLTRQADGAIWINNVHNYADIRLHLDYINNFVSGQNIPMENPIFSGTSPSYPFLIDFFAAQLVILGWPVLVAINAISAVFLLALAGSLYCLSCRVIPDKRVASLAAFLLFTNGGLGFFTHFLPELRAAHWQPNFFLTANHDYSLYQSMGYYFSNTIIAFFNPQRTLLFGYTLVMLILAELYSVRWNDSLKRYFLIGLMIALLPLVHTSSLLIVSFFLLFFFIRDFTSQPKVNWDIVKRWAVLVLPIATLGLLLIHVFISQADSLLSYIRFQPGWISQQPSQLVFWINNAGIALVTTVAAIVALRQSNPKASLFLGYSFILFFFANLIITQPWDFDNAKYLIYWYGIACIGMGAIVVWLWEKYSKVLAILLGLSLSITGIIDLIRRMDMSHNWYPIISKADLDQAALVGQFIPPTSRVLSIGDKLDPLTTNLGRRFVFGDDAWLWSHGIKGYKERSAQVHAIYRGESNAEQLIKQLGIDYIIISNYERERENSLDERFFVTRYEQVYTEDTLTVFKVD